MRILEALESCRLAALFWTGITVSIACILKTNRRRSVQAYDILFFLASWELFNIGYWQNYLASNINPAYAYSIAAILCALLAHWYAHRRGVTIWWFLGLEQMKDAAAWIALLFVALVPIGFLTGFLQFHPRLDIRYATGTIFGYALVAIVEETYFRGIVLQLCRRAVNDTAALAITTVLFATIYTHLTGGGHFPNWPYVGMALIAGFVYGKSFLESNTLAVPVIIHAAVDSIWRIFLS